MNPNLVGVLAIIAAIGYFQIRSLLKPEQRTTLVWFCIVHGIASTMAVLQTVGAPLPNPSRIIERASTAALRFLGIL